MLWIVAGPLLSKEEQAFLQKLKPLSHNMRLVAVDGALSFLPPENLFFACGDWDSLASPPPEHIPHHTLSPEKPLSDLAWMLDWLSLQEPQAVLLVGFQGGRKDHEWANFFEVLRFVQKTPSLEKVELCGAQGHFFWTTPSAPLRGRAALGTPCSLFALTSAHRFSLFGMKWNLQKNILYRPSHGLSNCVTGQPWKVVTHEGVGLFWIPDGTGCCLKEKPCHTP